MTILASTVTCKTMADDTLRLTIDIEPRYAQEAFALFGSRGVPCVVARITSEAAQKAEIMPGNTTASPEAGKPAGGPLARLAGMLCANPQFQEWALEIGDRSAENAAEFIRAECGIASRRELDHNEAAAEAFHARIRLPFLAWQEGK